MPQPYQCGHSELWSGEKEDEDVGREAEWGTDRVSMHGIW